MTHRKVTRDEVETYGLTSTSVTLSTIRNRSWTWYSFEPHSCSYDFCEDPASCEVGGYIVADRYEARRGAGLWQWVPSGMWRENADGTTTDLYEWKQVRGSGDFWLRKNARRQIVREFDEWHSPSYDSRPRIPKALLF